MVDGYHMPKLQKLRSSRSEEKIPSTHGNKTFKSVGKNLRSMTDYDFISCDDKDLKDDDNDVLIAGSHKI